MTPEAWVAMGPEGIRDCTGHDHPVLSLREADGARRLLVRLSTSLSPVLAEADPEDFDW
jgi:hypothetical protein